MRIWTGLAGVCCALVGCAANAQNFETLHQFTALNTAFINADGAFPSAGLVSISNKLYGTSSQGGAAGGGTIFRLDPAGTGFTAVYSFTPPNPNTGSPGDGAYPLAGLAVAGDLLFGTTSAGGAADNGIIFSVRTDGTGFSALHAFSATDASFANADGAQPWAGLTLSGTVLYGTTSRGGDAGNGTVFKINTDGTGFMRLHSFAVLDATTGTNSDGAYPLASLVLWSNALYGTTYRGGGLGTGTVFRLNLDGSGFTVLHDAEGGSRGSLTVSGNVLFGTTESGGSFGGGTVFKLNTDGSAFTNIYSFSGGAGSGPWAGVVLVGSTLYGTTYGGGDSGQGQVFGLNVDGTGFTNLYSFTGKPDGAYPQAPVSATGTALYGTASVGGASDEGTVFGLTLGQVVPSQLSIQISGGNAILTWPAGAGGLSLQSTTNLASPIIWNPVTPAPVNVNGMNTVTNPISGAATFYRLGR